MAKMKITECPSCKSGNTLKISRARNTKEKIIKNITWFDLYRCKKCGWRGWKMNIYFKKRSIKRILIYVLPMIIAAFVVYNLLKLVV